MSENTNIKTSDPVVVCTYGPSGVGKTTDCGYSFPRALFLAAPGALNSIQSVCGYTPDRLAVATIEEATAIIEKVGQSKKYKTVVIDDFSFMAEQTFSALESNPKFKGFALWGRMRDIALEFRDRSRYAGVNVILNCFSRSTEFVSSEGVKSFTECVDGQELTVLTHKGVWKKAKVRSYGNRQMNQITISRGKAKYQVKATPDHRWLLRDESETTALTEGARLLPGPAIFNSFDFATASDRQQMAWVQGFLVGDGSMQVRKSGAHYASVRLCGKKAEHLEKFTKLGFSHTFPHSTGKDPLVYLSSAVKKEILDTTDPLLVQAFIAGWMAADGHNNKSKTSRSYNPYTGITTTSRKNADYLRKNLPVAGCYIVSETSQKIGTFGSPQSKEPVWFVTLEGIGSTPGYGREFVVERIEPCGSEEAWCLEVEDDHSFVFPFGVSTGNCWEQPPKTRENGQAVRGGPQLSGKLPEQIPALCDIVLRAAHDKKRKPWGAVYRCAADPSYVMKDRFHIAAQVDPAPMNIGELLRASGVEIDRLPEIKDQESLVQKISENLTGKIADDMMIANEIYTSLLEKGMPPIHAKWTLRDALDRAVIRRELNTKSMSFFDVSSGSLS